MKVYLLTIDIYEDRCPIGVFSSIEQLEKFKNKLPHKDYKLEEFELDYIPDISDGQSIYNVYHDHLGKITSCKVDISYINSVNKLVNHIGLKNKYSTYVWASSEEESIRIAEKIISGEK